MPDGLKVRVVLNDSMGYMTLWAKPVELSRQYNKDKYPRVSIDRISLHHTNGTEVSDGIYDLIHSNEMEQICVDVNEAYLDDEFSYLQDKFDTSSLIYSTIPEVTNWCRCSICGLTLDDSKDEMGYDIEIFFATIKYPSAMSFTKDASVHIEYSYTDKFEICISCFRKLITNSEDIWDRINEVEYKTDENKLPIFETVYALLPMPGYLKYTYGYSNLFVEELGLQLCDII